MVATPLPIMLVKARHSLMKRSIPTRIARDSIGTDGTTEIVAAKVTPGSDLHASSAYRRHLLRQLARRALLTALAMKA